MNNKTQRLIESVLETRPSFYDNPNGGFEYTCPFCGAMVVSSNYNSLSEFSHDEDCTYILASNLYNEMKSGEDEIKTELSEGYSYSVGKFNIILDENTEELKVFVHTNKEHMQIKPSSGNSVILMACK